MASDERTAARGAAQLAHLALRNELRKLDKLAKTGLVVDKQQRELLAHWADQFQALAVGAGEEPPTLFHPAPRKRP